MEKETFASKRRWMQLSLRNFFILLTVVCVLLGWKINSAIQQREAIEVIRDAGGGFAYDFHHVRGNQLLNNLTGESPVPLWLQNMLGVDFFADVIQVDCHGTAFEEIKAIGKLRQLQRLNLNGTRVSTLSPLAGLVKLQTLECLDTNIADVYALRRCVELQFLQLNGTKVSDLKPIAKLTRLEQLFLRDTNVRDISPLASLKGLQFLGLRGTRVSDISPLRHHTKLKWLDLRNTAVTREDLQSLERALPSCNIEFDRGDWQRG